MKIVYVLIAESDGENSEILSVYEDEDAANAAWRDLCRRRAYARRTLESFMVYHPPGIAEDRVSILPVPFVEKVK